ncbi:MULTISPECIES: MerR family transcriptional regulator [Actinotignum]|uniref:MerR family transcriptional regulator n=1 Tax=Actinotignum TaxID=1653174 RepID=UPI00254F91BE|nr:MerR family transcriptional regulator [Actinotignum schaalii]MDK7271874.1 MerR family transcriptional regulator [Actinotignum schaalii]
MKTVNEVSKIAGISVRTLQYYDRIGLLKPTDYSDAGYRLYSDSDVKQLQYILLFRELEFPLKEIKTIVHSKNFNEAEALDQQITLLSLKRDRLEALLDFAKRIKSSGGTYMDFTVFDTGKIDDYARQARERWGTTSEYQEYESKHAGRNATENQAITQSLMLIFGEFGKIKTGTPDSPEAQALVKKLQGFITDNFYTCTDEILAGLGEMYADGGEFTRNIDDFAGEGTAVFVHEAIKHYCA